MPWRIVGRKIGPAGNERQRTDQQREWDRAYGEDNWAVGYLIDGEFVLQEKALETVYYSSYEAHFREHPGDLRWCAQLDYSFVPRVMHLELRPKEGWKESGKSEKVLDALRSALPRDEWHYYNFTSDTSIWESRVESNSHVYVEYDSDLIHRLCVYPSAAGSPTTCYLQSLSDRLASVHGLEILSMSGRSGDETIRDPRFLRDRSRRV